MVYLNRLTESFLLKILLLLAVKVNSCFWEKLKFLPVYCNLFMVCWLCGCYCGGDKKNEKN